MGTPLTIVSASARHAAAVVSDRARLGSRDRGSHDSPLEESGFEPSVPLLRKALLGVANRRRRHERRSHLEVQARDGNACLEWLPIAFSFTEGPRVRIRLPPAVSLRTIGSAVGEHYSPRDGI